MKKADIFKIGGIAAILLGLAVMFSCSKIELTEKNGAVPADETEQTKAVYAKVVGFLQKVEEARENPLFKSGEMLHKEEAVWGLNAGFNLQQSKPDGMYNGFYVDSSFVSLPLTVNDSVSISDIADAYSAIESNALAILNDAPFQEKASKFTFIEVESDDNMHLALKCVTIVGEKGTDPEPPFAFGDDWRYGNDLGKCEDPYVIGDAGDTIGSHINANRYLYVHDEGKTVFYTNPVTIGSIEANEVPEFLNPNDPTPDDNYRDYLMFYVHEDNCAPGQNLWDDFSCIGYADMNFYYFGTTHVIYHKIPNLPQYWPAAHNKTFMHLGELHGTDREDQFEKDYYIHIIKNIRYAKRWVLEQ